MYYLRTLAFVILLAPSLTFADSTEPDPGFHAITFNQAFLNKPLLYPQILEKGEINYFRYVYDPIANPFESEKREFTATLSQLRHPQNAVVMNRFDNPFWIPELLEKAKNDPWTSIDEVYDFAVDEVELIGVLNANTTCVLNAFKKFDVYSMYVGDGYFIYSYELSPEEANILKLPPAKSNELYHYNIFYPSSFVGAYQSVVKYQIGRSHYEIAKNASLIKVPQLVIAWELIPVDNLKLLPGRGDKASRNEEREWRKEIESQMFANSGYVVFEPLVINEEPYGEYEECTQSDKQCEKRHGAKEETLAHGIFYLKPDLPLGDYPFIRQNLMEAIMSSIISGLRTSITDAKNGRVIRTIDGTLQPLKIEGCVW